MTDDRIIQAATEALEAECRRRMVTSNPLVTRLVNYRLARIVLAAAEPLIREQTLQQAADDFRAEGRDVMFNRARHDLPGVDRVARWLRDRAARIARGEQP